MGKPSEMVVRAVAKPGQEIEKNYPNTRLAKVKAVNRGAGTVDLEMQEGVIQKDVPVVRGVVDRINEGDTALVGYVGRNRNLPFTFGFTPLDQGGDPAGPIVTGVWSTGRGPYGGTDVSESLSASLVDLSDGTLTIGPLATFPGDPFVSPPLHAPLQVLAFKFNGTTLIGVAMVVDNPDSGNDLSIQVWGSGGGFLWEKRIEVGEDYVGLSTGDRISIRRGWVMQHDQTTQSLLIHPPLTGAMYQLGVANGALLASAETGFENWWSSGWKVCRGIIVETPSTAQLSTLSAYRAEVVSGVAFPKIWEFDPATLLPTGPFTRFGFGAYPRDFKIGGGWGLPCDFTRSEVVVPVLSWSGVWNEQFAYSDEVWLDDYLASTGIYLFWLDLLTGNIKKQWKALAQNGDPSYIAEYGSATADAALTDFLAANTVLDEFPGAGNLGFFRNRVYSGQADQRRGFLLNVGGSNWDGRPHPDPLVPWPNWYNFLSRIGTADLSAEDIIPGTWQVLDLCIDHQGNTFMAVEKPLIAIVGKTPGTILYDGTGDPLEQTVGYVPHGTSTAAADQLRTLALLKFDSAGVLKWETNFGQVSDYTETLYGANTYTMPFQWDEALVKILPFSDKIVLLRANAILDLTGANPVIDAWKTLAEGYDSVTGALAWTNDALKVPADPVVGRADDGTLLANLQAVSFAIGCLGATTEEEWIVTESDDGGTPYYFKHAAIIKVSDGTITVKDFGFAWTNGERAVVSDTIFFAVHRLGNQYILNTYS